MSYPINFSMTLQTEILSKGTSDFLKQTIILKLFNSKKDFEEVQCVGRVDYTNDFNGE